MSHSPGGLLFLSHSPGGLLFLSHSPGGLLFLSHSPGGLLFLSHSPGGLLFLSHSPGGLLFLSHSPGGLLFLCHSQFGFLSSLDQNLNRSSLDVIAHVFCSVDATLWEYAGRLCHKAWGCRHGHEREDNPGKDSELYPLPYGMPIYRPHCLWHFCTACPSTGRTVCDTSVRHAHLPAALFVTLLYGMPIYRPQCLWHFCTACPSTGRTVCDTSVRQAAVLVLASFVIQSILIHNYPLHGATCCIGWPSWINYVFNLCYCRLLSLTNSLRRSSWFLKMDFPDLWQNTVFQPVISHCIFCKAISSVKFFMDVYFNLVEYGWIFT